MYKRRKTAFCYPSAFCYQLTKCGDNFDQNTSTAFVTLMPDFLRPHWNSILSVLVSQSEKNWLHYTKGHIHLITYKQGSTFAPWIQWKVFLHFKSPDLTQGKMIYRHFGPARIHICTMDTMEGFLTFQESWPHARKNDLQILRSYYMYHLVP